MTDSHDEEILQQFKKQAENFTENLSINQEKYIDWAIAGLQPKQTDRVLDVAAGTGAMSRALAPHVQEIIAIDYSPDMIKQGESELENLSIRNVQFRQGSAEKLPFSDNTFDIVVSRLAFHHFKYPKTVLREMTRVAKGEGLVLVIDLTAPGGPTIKETLNHYERLRDPSHTNTLTRGEFLKMFLGVDLQVTHSEVIFVERDLADWLDLSEATEEAAKEIIQAFDDELAGGEETGLYPYYEKNQRMFTHQYIKLLGKK